MISFRFYYTSNYINNIHIKETKCLIMIWLFQNIIFSISLIVVLHYLYIYFKTTLTSPRVKDLIHCPKQKYDTLFETIEKGNREIHELDYPTSSIIPKSSSLGIPITHHNEQCNDNGSPNSYKSINTQLDPQQYMKTELKAYLKTLGLKKNQQSSKFGSSIHDSNGEMITN